MKYQSKATQDQSEMDVIFVHSELDDRNLSVAEFRVYCHLARRAGKGTAFPGIKSMAQVCRISKPTVIEAVKSLEECGMVEAERVAGKTTHYTLTAKSKWTPLHEGCPNRSKTGNGATGQNEVTHRSKRGNGTGQNEVMKGNPRKVIKLRESNSPADSVTADAVYASYPRKVARPKALAAIASAVKRGTSMAVLLERTEMMAEFWNGVTDKAYCPHPATWFNQDRFNDDPEEWKPKESRNGHTKPTDSTAENIRLGKLSDAARAAGDEELAKQYDRQIARLK